MKGIIKNFDVTVNLWIAVSLPTGLSYEEWEDYAKDRVEMLLRDKGFIVDYKILDAEINDLNEP